ncbi:hypothetical protein HDV00_001680 [Rhizophlyctis rosea]|nr:hypothetical protein HDV00_001680 [Rhizophlyctis rosea]
MDTTLSLRHLAQDLRRTVISSARYSDNPNLSVLIQEERDVVSAFQELSKEKLEAGNFLHKWGTKEGDEDLVDVTSKMKEMYEKFAEVQSILAEHYSLYRSHLKSIKQAEDAFHKLHKFQEAIEKRLEALQHKKHGDMNAIGAARAELAQSEAEIELKGAELRSLKRAALRSGLDAQFDGILEAANKLSVIGTYGKHLTTQIPLVSHIKSSDPLPKYEGAPTTSQIMSDFRTAYTCAAPSIQPPSNIAPTIILPPPSPSTSPQPPFRPSPSPPPSPKVKAKPNKLQIRLNEGELGRHASLNKKPIVKIPEIRVDMKTPIAAGLGLFVVCFAFLPGREDEIALGVGDVIAATETFEDGWACGFSYRTGLTGFFPFNAVVAVVDEMGKPVPPSPGQRSPEELMNAGDISKEEYQVIAEAMRGLVEGNVPVVQAKEV